MSPAALLGLALAFNPAAHAGGQEAYEAGVTADRAGDAPAAAARFLEALEAGARDPVVYHGLGNALYRQGKRGPAIAAWRRGLVLAPRDPDLQANLDRAVRETTDRLEATERGPSPLFWKGWLSPRQGALGAGLCAALGLSLVLGHRLRGGVRLWTGPTTALLSLSALLTLSTVVASREQPGAVITAPAVSARSTPSADGVELFVLHEGALVEVDEQSGESSLIHLPDGRKAWVPTETLLSADPADPFPP
jgi:hypothetical protein